MVKSSCIMIQMKTIRKLVNFKCSSILSAFPKKAALAHIKNNMN